MPKTLTNPISSVFFSKSLISSKSQNEAMTGTHTQNPIYSRITMALMEDTGWYLPNYDMADDFKWGRNLGCDFARKSCLEWMESRQKLGQSIHPFCNKVKRDPLETECTDDRSSVALCNLVQHDNVLPPHFQVHLILVEEDETNVSNFHLFFPS